MVKLVIFDCDLTLWDHHNVSELHPPFTRVDETTVVDGTGTEIRLLPGALELLAELRERGILISIVSWNQPEPVFAILEALGLLDHFTRPKVEFHPYEERTVAALLEELAADGVNLRPEEILYVDDRALHFRRVRNAVGPIRTLRAGTESRDLRDVLDHLANQTQRIVAGT